jgi:hypothetical protein
MRIGRKAAQRMDEIANGWTIRAKYTGYTTAQAARARTNIEVTYKEMP